MNKLDEAIANTTYILDSLRALREIRETGSCNECKIRKVCAVVPKCGQMVRYNCPFFEEDAD